MLVGDAATYLRDVCTSTVPNNTANCCLPVSAQFQMFPGELTAGGSPREKESRRPMVSEIPRVALDECQLLLVLMKL